MEVEESLRTGDIATAMSGVKDRVRKNPAEAKHRILLFQMMCIEGEWDRALNQLKVLADLDPITMPMVQTYEAALQCQALRDAVFAGKRTPMLVGEPDPWMGQLFQALALVGEGKIEAAAAARGAAFEDAPATSGKLNGEPFAWIADADSRIGPFLEAIVGGRYLWIPFHHLISVDIEPPEDLRDLVWAPAHLKFATGGEQVALIPTRYPGSAQHGESAVRMSRRTEWSDLGNDTYAGAGQRMLATDTGDTPLLEVRRIELDVTPPEAETAETE